jgi:regulator of RNase E activity RraA
MPEPKAYHIRSRVERVDPRWVEAFQEAPTGNVCDALGQPNVMQGVFPLALGRRLVGPAVTVRARPGDNLILYRVLEFCSPGDVLVIATGAHRGCATMGDLVVQIFQKASLAGVVTDGLVRDREGIVRIGLPVFAAGTHPFAPGKEGGISANYPVTCGGVLVEPGDLILGDDDGVVVVPRAEVPAAAAQLPAIRAKEARTEEGICAGKLIPDHVAAILAEKNYLIEE